MIGLTGLLNLVAVVEQLQTTQIVEEEGTVCLPERSPPAPRRKRRHPLLESAATHESPTPRVAAQSSPDAPAAHFRSQKGGRL
jgi:hypothetical protein